MAVTGLISTLALNNKRFQLVNPSLKIGEIIPLSPLDAHCLQDIG